MAGGDAAGGLNLALLAIPLGAVNPRLGRSGDLLIAGLVGLLYMNMINLSRAWISSGKISFSTSAYGPCARWWRCWRRTC